MVWSGIEAWVVFSNFAYLGTAACATWYSLYTRTVGFVLVSVVSAWHHYCNDTGDGHTTCDANTADLWHRVDHVASVWAAASIVLLFVPLEASDWRVEALIDVLVVGGATAVVQTQGANSATAPMLPFYEALVTAGALVVAIVCAYGLRRCTCERMCVDTRGCGLTLLLLAMVLLLWELPQWENDRVAHGWWHVLSAILAVRFVVMRGQSGSNSDPLAHCFR